jgi:hypothetical protein
VIFPNKALLYQRGLLSQSLLYKEFYQLISETTTTTKDQKRVLASGTVLLLVDENSDQF